MQMTLNETSAAAPAPQSSPPKVDNNKTSSDDKTFQDSLDAKIHVDRENKKAADDQQNGSTVPATLAASTTAPIVDAQQQIAFAQEIAKIQADSSQGNAVQQAITDLTKSMQQISNQAATPIMDLIQQMQDASKQQAQPTTNQVKVDVQVNSQASLQLLAQQEAGSKAAANLVLAQNDPKIATPVVEKVAQAVVVEKTAPAADTNAEKTAATAQIQPARPDFLTQFEALKNQSNETTNAVLSQITERIKTTMDAGKDVVRIQMQPENLGKVDVRIVRGSDGVQFFFTADTVSTSRMLQSTMNQLHQSLLDAGVKVGNMSVSYQGQGQQNNQGQSQHKNGFSFFGQDDSDLSADYTSQGALTALDAKA